MSVGQATDGFREADSLAYFAPIPPIMRVPEGDFDVKTTPLAIERDLSRPRLELLPRIMVFTANAKPTFLSIRYLNAEVGH